jgi:hypothetical protein
MGGDVTAEWKAVVEPIDEESQRISIRQAKRSGIRRSSTGLVLRSARFFENLVIVRKRLSSQPA